MKSKIILALAIFCGIWASAQKFSKEDLQNASHQERMMMLRKIQTERIITELNIPQDKQEKLQTVLNNFYDDEHKIMKSYRHDEITDNMSDKDARKKLDLGFDVAKKLLNNRKAYTKKFLEILTPQQVLKMYKIEKEIKAHFKNKSKNKHNDKS